MTEHEAKVLAAELEHNKYWRVVSISAPYKMRDYVGGGFMTRDGYIEPIPARRAFLDEEHVTVRIEHRMVTHSITCSGVVFLDSLMRDLIENGPKYAEKGAE